MTTSNIHIGLAAWQTSHSYSIGNRISSAGNAYQAISSGTSGATTPTGTSTSFSDGAVYWKYLSSIDYTSLTAWGNAIPNTLSSNVVGQLWNDGVITTTLGNPFLVLGVSGAQRNTGIYTITLTCAPGESFRDTLKGTNLPLAANPANGVCFSLPASGNGGINYFDIYDSPVIFSGIQFIDPNSTSNSTIINCNASTVTSVSQCIIDGFGQGGAYILSCANTLLMSNCLVVDRQSAGNEFSLVVGSSASTIVNTTFVCPTTAATLTYITPTSGGSVSDSSGNVYTMDSSGNMYENSILVPGSGGTAQITVVSGVIWAQDAGSGTWYTWNGSYFIAQGGAPSGGASLGAGTAYNTYAGTPLSRNNIFCGYANPVGSGVIADHCAFTSTTVGYGTNNGSNQFSIVAASQFISGTTDFHLKVGSTCISTGITDATDIPLSNDIIGYARPQGITWGIGAAEFTGQFKATGKIGAIKVTSTIATANSASLTRSLGSFTCSASAQQVTFASATASIPAITLSASSNQVFFATLVVSVGPISLAACTITQTNVATAAISLIPTIAATAAQYYPASGQISIGAITSPIIAMSYDAMFGTVSIGPTTTYLSTASQYDLANATITLAITSTGLVSQSIVFASAQVSLSIVPPTVPPNTFLQEDKAHATVSMGPIAIVTTAYQSDLTSSTVTIGAISPSITMRQDDNEAAICNIVFSCVAAIGQYAPTYTTGSLGPITLIGAANATYLLSATPSIGTITSVPSFAGQSDLLALTVQLGPITSIGTSTNPIPAVAQVTVGMITAVATVGFTYNATATVTIGPMTCVATSGVFTGTVTLGNSGFSCVGTASNPYPATAQITLGSFSLTGIALSLVPIPASAIITLGQLSALSTTAQYDLSSALISLIVVARATVTNAPRLRISQLPIETLSSGGALRVSQTAIETLSSGGALRVSQTAIEILTQSALPSAGRVSQIVGEVLASGTSRALASQVVQEILTGGSALQNVRLSQIVTEVMTGGSTAQNVLMSQVVLEALISAVPLRIISTTYIMV